MVGETETESAAATARRAVKDRAGTDARIVRAALEILRLHGPHRVTVEAVAALSGVAKTTIYRRYANREEILEAALHSQMASPCVPDGLCVYDRVKWTIELIRRGLSSDVGMGSVGALLTDQEPGFTEPIREIINARSEVVAEVLRNAIDAGAIRDDLDVDTAVSMLVGAYLGAYLRHGEVGESWADEVVHIVCPELEPDTTEQRP
ncbi:TetR/AcrR family transcriptional regulator [Rhodococcus sp. CH91]|uniref:TetR/AcrR family transcriptional regulator n=1 Tax=Rhodococcus sp. CH91 TaxID=2910256 RepID=UPI001F4BB28B|nr:TetR/AcrR family transcriptional regulator [Rhodococcus sp. CH91]